MCPRAAGWWPPYGPRSAVCSSMVGQHDAHVGAATTVAHMCCVTCHGKAALAGCVVATVGRYNARAGTGLVVFE